jgi:UDP-3-O-[3-hydroxymyristoyl] glucosamine N-acyltransferase
MKLSDLKKYDSSLNFKFNAGWPEDLETIANIENLRDSTFVFVKNIKFFNKLDAKLNTGTFKESGVIFEEKFFLTLKPELVASLEAKLGWFATSQNVALSLTVLSKPFYDKKLKGVNTQVDGRQMGTVDIHPTAMVAQNVFIGEYVKIGADVEIMPGTVILPYSEIGEGTKIYPNVTIYPFTKIGKNCRFHSSVVIGSDGFGYTFNQGQHQKIWHMGGVEIHDDVEIGANSAVDCGTFSPTIIGAGTRIDNSVQIAHNCKVGRGCVLCGHSGLAGSAVIEDYVVLGGKAGVGPDAHLGMGTQVAGAAMVNEGAVWPAGSKLGGHPARDLKEWMRGFAYIRKMSIKETKIKE